MKKEKVTTIYKLTNKNLQTRDGFQWEIGKWYETSGGGELCDEGWLHAYHSPDLAILLNPIHAGLDEETMRLWKAEGRGKSLDDCGLKVGFSEMRIIEEIKKPEWTITQRVAFGILCAMEACKDEEWTQWARGWLDDKDRSDLAEAARAAARARAEARAWAAAWAEAWAGAEAWAAAEAAAWAAAEAGAAAWAEARAAAAARAAARAAAWAAAEAGEQPLGFTKICKKARMVK